MIQTYDDALEAIAKRTYKNKQNINQKDRQRRYSFTDLYGVEFKDAGDVNAPATFYVGISKDMEYLNRFEFKVIIEPFVSYVASGGTQPATVIVKETELTLSGGVITPARHDHDTQAHTHNVASGITLTQVTATQFRMYMDGIDITPYLMAQYGNWINGEGIFPSADIGEDYDILVVGCDFEAQGNTAARKKLTSAGNHKIEITADGPFDARLITYLKYSNMNR